MKFSSEFNCLYGIFPLLLSLTACAEALDHSNETPVNPEPGLYEVSLSGAGLQKFGKKETPNTYCLREADRTAFAHMLVQNYYQLHYSCKTEKLPRKGNAIAGEISCPVDPKLAEGASHFAYQGNVRNDMAHINVQMKFETSIKDDTLTKAEAFQLKLALKAMEKLRFTIEANRIGNCE